MRIRTRPSGRGQLRRHPSGGLSRSFSNRGFSHRRPGAWLKPVLEKPAKAGSGICFLAHPALKELVYYASLQAAEAASLNGTHPPKVSVPRRYEVARYI